MSLGGGGGDGGGCGASVAFHNVNTQSAPKTGALTNMTTSFRFGHRATDRSCRLVVRVLEVECFVPPLLRSLGASRRMSSISTS